MSGHFPLIHVTVPGEPVPKGRPRVGSNGAKSPGRTAEAQSRIAWRVKESCVGLGLPRDGLFRVFLVFRTRRPADDNGSADGDNCEKLILDALNGVVWVDDRQVAGVTWTIERGVERPETVIAIFEEEAA